MTLGIQIWSHCFRRVSKNVSRSCKTDSSVDANKTSIDGGLLLSNMTKSKDLSITFSMAAIVDDFRSKKK
jgi:hypothetical protein